MVTTSFDNTIRVWTPVGDPLGVLSCTHADVRMRCVCACVCVFPMLILGVESAQISAGIRLDVPWRFRVDVEGRRRALIEHAHEIQVEIDKTLAEQRKAKQRRKVRRPCPWRGALLGAVPLTVSTVWCRVVRHDDADSSQHHAGGASQLSNCQPVGCCRCCVCCSRRGCTCSLGQRQRQ